MEQQSKISVFKSIYDVEPLKDTTLETFYSVVRDGNYKDEILKIRSASSPEIKTELKKKLPAVTPSGTFSHRKASAQRNHSGRICIDIDGKENKGVKSWEKLRDRIGTIEEVEFSALSASGRGLFCVILIKYPDMHLRHFRSLFRDFLTLGLNIDKSCSDVSRLRLLTWDADAIYNDSANYYEKIYKDPEIIHRQRKDSKLQDIIDRVISSGVDITDFYKDWLEIGRALVNEYGESGRSYFHALSRFNPGYNPDKCDRQYNACLRSPGKASAGTVFYLAKTNGITLKDKVATPR